MQELVTAVEQAPSLALMLLAAGQLAHRIAVLLVQEVLTQRAQRPAELPSCPKCGTRLRSKGFLPRQLTTRLGIVRWERRVGRCPKGCKIGQVAPLDETLGLTPHQQTSVALKQMACALAIFVPFETAVVLLQRLLGLPVSPSTLWHWVQEAGQSAMQRLQRELDQLAEGQPPTAERLDENTSAQPLLIGADGVMVPFRPENGTPKGRTVWREVKVAILARLGQRTTRHGQTVTRLERRRLVAVLGDIEALRPRLWLEAWRQGIGQAKVVVWLSDGGRGFWNLYVQRFAVYAIGILDFYHAAQNLWKGAAAWLDGRTTQARVWFDTMRHCLRHGEQDRVLEELAAALQLEGLPDSARKTLSQVYAYLQTHREHIDYAKFKELGLPLGSGLVESACKWLIQQRFKGVGMRWSEDGFNHLLHLRLAWVNGRFDALFAEPSPNR
ncbi:MAG: ISKra4 family transposase [Chloroflexi bacterium]|nr:ISKra4 family transposase [Chloroflexota bacterium]